MKVKINLEVFAVVNSEGKFLRAKGFFGRGDFWVDDINKAKIYPKIGSARQRVSYFANRYPEFGIPKILKMTVTSAEVIDDSERVKDTQKIAEERVLKNEQARIEQEAARLKLEKKRIEKKLKDLHG